MASKPDVGSLPLLHIDDSADDRIFLREAIAITKTAFTLYEADSLEAAVPYFRFHGDDGKFGPSLVLLDFNLGKNTGIDFLHWLRIKKKMTAVEVVVFSGSTKEQDIEDCYVNGANHFLSKPTDLARLKVIVRSLHLSFAVLKRPGPLVLLPEYRPDPRGEIAAPQPKAILRRSQ
jgi:DNA-binding response OmpR family regulator